MKNPVDFQLKTQPQMAVVTSLQLETLRYLGFIWAIFILAKLSVHCVGKTKIFPFLTLSTDSFAHLQIYNLTL